MMQVWFQTLKSDRTFDTGITKFNASRTSGQMNLLSLVEARKNHTARTEGCTKPYEIILKDYEVK